MAVGVAEGVVVAIRRVTAQLRGRPATAIVTVIAVRTVTLQCIVVMPWISETETSGGRGCMECTVFAGKHRQGRTDSERTCGCACPREIVVSGLATHERVSRDPCRQGVRRENGQGDVHAVEERHTGV